MEAWEWIVLAAAVAAVLVVGVAAFWLALRKRRRARLKERFGAEYEHAVSTAGKHAAERQLADVERKHDDLDIHALPATSRERYLAEWRDTESRFVSDPGHAVRGAERIVVRVLEQRGYPVNGDLDDESAAFVAADYPDLVQRYRRAHDLVESSERSTENLRLAMIDLRIVLDELLVRERTMA